LSSHIRSNAWNLSQQGASYMAAISSGRRMNVLTPGWSFCMLHLLPALPAGVGWVRLATPLGEVDVFNTHLHANYCHDYRHPDPALVRAAATAAGSIGEERGDTAAVAAAEAALEAAGRGRLGVPPEAWLGSRVADDDDAGVRISQLLELTEIVRLASGDACSSSSDAGGGSSSGSSSSSGERLVVLGGDLNCKPDTLEVDLLRMRLPGMKDAWAAAAAAGGGGDSSSASPDGDGDGGGSGAGANPEGYTCHAPGNTFQPRRQVRAELGFVGPSHMLLSTTVFVSNL
jgi:sphingomyelin phosphodiesterase 2